MKRLFLLFCLLVSSNCFAAIDIKNDTLDQYSQQFAVSANYKICGVANGNNIAGNCIANGTTNILRYGNYDEITMQIPNGYEVVIESINVYDQKLNILYTQQVQTQKSPNLCSSSGPVIHLGAYIPTKLVSCNNFNYPQ